MHASHIRGSGNEKNKRTSEFWMVLALVNVLAFIYPINLLLRANGVDENFFATCVFIGSVFLLMVVNALSIVAADPFGIGKH